MGEDRGTRFAPINTGNSFNRVDPEAAENAETAFPDSRVNATDCPPMLAVRQVLYIEQC